MAQVRVGLMCVFAVLAGTQGAWAQTPQGWDVSVDFLIIATRGNDVHAGDVFTETLRATGTSAQTRVDYGVTYEPIVTRMKRDQSALIEVRYRGARWGFGARGWRVQTDGDASGADSSAPSTASSESTTGIRLWDQSLFPVTNLHDPSGVSPVTFYAQNELKNIRIEAFAERRVIAGSDFNLDARMGIAHARLENDRSEGQTMVAFTQDLVGATLITTDNPISIDAESHAKTSMTGPMVGLAGDSTFGRIRVDWGATQSVLMGTAETTGRWTDVDNIVETDVTGGVATVMRTQLNGLIPMALDHRVMVPVLDLQVKLSVRATRMVRLGAGVLSSTWFHAPVAPAFSVPGQWTDVDGTGWRDQQRDVTFTAFSGFVGFGF